MQRRRIWWWLPAAAGLIWLAGCVNVKAPERIDVRAGSDRPERVDSSRVPRTASHEEAQSELERAYANLRYLERENAELQEKADKYKRERDDYKKRLKRYEDD